MTNKNPTNKATSSWDLSFSLLAFMLGHCGSSSKWVKNSFRFYNRFIFYNWSFHQFVITNLLEQVSYFTYYKLILVLSIVIEQRVWEFTSLCFVCIRAKLSIKFPPLYTTTTLLGLMASIKYAAIGVAFEHRVTAWT